MRKLSYLFMTLSALCFAMPAFAQGWQGRARPTGLRSPPDSPWRSLPPYAALAQGKAVAAATESWPAILPPAPAFNSP